MIGIIIAVLGISAVWFLVALNRPKTDPVDQPPKVNLVTIDFLGHKITVNTRYAHVFNEVDQYIMTDPVLKGKIADKVYRVDSYNPRYIAGTKIWSYHAYGQAVDVNPDQFPLKQGAYPLPYWFVSLGEIMIDNGFRWGADFHNKFDPMHFEIGTGGT